ncbi:MAG: hypothetical protein VKS61_03560 [Candidatus Sericytochromatia bacterium]|nr:hypothetical protein [Candidatus Sericytochromatia bacterium]
MASLLDCTLRDGGHLNGWRFSHELVRALLVAAARSGVDAVELGYAHSPTDSQGPCAAVTAAWLDEVTADLAPLPRLAVMIDAGRCEPGAVLPLGAGWEGLVRVAAYPHELPRAFELVRALLAEGQAVCLNLSAGSALGPAELEALAGFEGLGALEAVVLADSFGALLPDRTRSLLQALRVIGCRRLGFHAHNNLQLAFANALAALEAGVESLDACAFGMGRGAGNLPMELILGHLQRGSGRLSVAPYLAFVETHIAPLQPAIDWGYTLPGLLSGLGGLHPSYGPALVARAGSAAAAWQALAEVDGALPLGYEAAALARAWRGPLQVRP